MALGTRVSRCTAVFSALILLIAGSSALTTPSEARNAATEEVLAILRDPTKYDRSVMPLNKTGPVESEVQIYFREVDVDDIKMSGAVDCSFSDNLTPLGQITVDMTFRMVWTDPRLTYKTLGVPYVTISDPELAWIPDAFFKRAISTQQQMTVFPQNFLRVHRSGKLIFSTRLMIVFSCPMDFSRFPHDRQQCVISIASYGYTQKDLSFKFSEQHPITYIDGAMQSINFVVNDVRTESCDSKTSTGVYSCVQVALELDRVVNSYIVEWYIPCIFLVIVAAMSEVVVPSEFLSRVLLVLIPLITLCMYSIMYTLYTTPAVSYTRPIDIFSGISLVVIFLQLIRVMVLHYYAQRKIKEERGELLPRHPRDDFLETLIVNANFISKILLASFYAVFLLAYFLAYN